MIISQYFNYYNYLLKNIISIKKLGAIYGSFLINSKIINSNYT